MTLKDTVCIVTGSAAGIGAACAEGLAAQGGRVVVNYSKSDKEARAVAAACEARGGQAIVVQADVASDADCRKLAQAALDKWGRIDALVNNAGVTKFAQHADLDALQAADFQYIFGVNVVGAFQMVRAVAPAMQKQGKGAVVNVSSVAGVLGVGSSVAYAASKGALNTMTLSLARALGPAIRVNAVCPGFVETGWLKNGLGPTYQKQKESYEAMTPLKTVLTPEDVADTVLWLLQGAGKMTGEVIMLDGGLHLGFVNHAR
ncbi:MAG TPA: SDR family oxidoreductase [Verrucomicrobiae bacterium]|jgi:3-oxoacyl-[acyl-carrier protein] reductase|nr:SDR family oxidoreductase [Verrucomicrobiae bacterium]